VAASNHCLAPTMSEPCADLDDTLVLTTDATEAARLAVQAKIEHDISAPGVDSATIQWKELFRAEPWDVTGKVRHDACDSAVRWAALEAAPAMASSDGRTSAAEQLRNAGSVLPHVAAVAHIVEQSACMQRQSSTLVDTCMTATATRYQGTVLPPTVASVTLTATESLRSCRRTSRRGARSSGRARCSRAAVTRYRTPMPPRCSSSSTARAPRRSSSRPACPASLRS
jgi:hypothetical protein